MIHFCKVKKRKETFKEIIDKTIKKKKVIKTISFSVEEKSKKSGAPTRKLKSPPPPTKQELDVDEDETEDVQTPPSEQVKEENKDDLKEDQMLNPENEDKSAINDSTSELDDKDDVFADDEDDDDGNVKLFKAPPPLVHSASFFMTNNDTQENDIFEPSKIHESLYKYLC